MITIETVALTRMHVEEHFQFMRDMDAIFSEFQPEANSSIKSTLQSIYNLYPQFKELLEKEGLVVSAIRKNIYTRSVIKADKLRDMIYMGLKTFFKSYAYNLSLEKREAAQRIVTIIENYKDPRKRPFNEETATLRNLIQDLRDRCKDNLDLIGETAHQWLSDQEETNNAFEEAMILRYNDKMETAGLKFSEISVEINQVYARITTIIDVVIFVEQDESYINMANKINERVRYYKTTLAQRKGRAGTKGEEEDNDD